MAKVESTYTPGPDYLVLVCAAFPQANGRTTVYVTDRATYTHFAAQGKIEFTPQAQAGGLVADYEPESNVAVVFTGEVADALKPTKSYSKPAKE